MLHPKSFGEMDIDDILTFYHQSAFKTARGLQLKMGKSMEECLGDSAASASHDASVLLDVVRFVQDNGTENGGPLTIRK